MPSDSGHAPARSAARDGALGETAPAGFATGRDVLWAKVVDQSRCIGCHACTTACKSENEVPLSVTRTYVKYVDAGVFPEARRSFQVTRCNQCDEPPCVDACPTAAMFRRPDGIVDFDKSACIGCKACIAACPYDAIFINPADHAAEKCNFCAHRLEIGLEPACVVVCPTEALLVGDMNDPSSEVAKIVHREAVTARRPEKQTKPKLFYKGADQAALDPLAAKRPGGGLFMWSEQGDGSGSGGAAASSAGIESGSARIESSSAGPKLGGPVAEPGVDRRTGPWNSSAAAVVSYDFPRKAPWDFRVSLYTWTKSIAAGAYLAPLLLIAVGTLEADTALWRTSAPVLATVFLALTGGLLIWDLERPTRFFLIFTRPQWRSWLVRGGFAIGAYAAFLAIHFVLAAGAGPPPPWLALVGGPLALLAAVYTAFLFGQAKGRDMWQNPLLPVHFLVQALLAGAGATFFLAKAATFMANAATPAAPAQATLGLLAAASAAHLLMIAGEVLMPAPTAHAKMAEREMVHGRWRSWFRMGVLGAAAGVAAPWLPAWLDWPAVLVAMAGLLAYEHAYVQSGQSVPQA